MVTLFSINELREVAAAALKAVRYAPPESARVRAVPDTRTIRYYTTLGLIDRPAEMRGRTAYYSRRHVLQIVAIKKRQAEDQALSDIQTELAGMTDVDLQRLVNLPVGFWEQARPPQPEQPQQSTAASQPSNDVSPDLQYRATLPSPIEDEPAVGLQSCVRVPLHSNVELLLNLTAPQAKALESETINFENLNRAARQLIDELVRQKLL